MGYRVFNLWSSFSNSWTGQCSGKITIFCCFKIQPLLNFAVENLGFTEFSSFLPRASSEVCKIRYVG